MSSDAPGSDETLSETSSASTLSQASGSEVLLDTTYLQSTGDSEAVSHGTFLQTNAYSDTVLDTTYLQTPVHSEVLSEIATDPDDTYLQYSDTSLGDSTLSEDSFTDIDQLADSTQQGENEPAIVTEHSRHSNPATNLRDNIK